MTAKQIKRQLKKQRRAEGQTMRRLEREAEAAREAKEALDAACRDIETV